MAMVFFFVQSSRTLKITTESMTTNLTSHPTDLLGESAFFKIRLCMEGNVTDSKSSIDNYRALVHFPNFVLPQGISAILRDVFHLEVITIEDHI